MLLEQLLELGPSVVGMATQARPPAARRTPPFGLLPHPPASQPMGTQPVSLSTPSPRFGGRRDGAGAGSGFVGLLRPTPRGFCGPGFLLWAQLSTRWGSKCARGSRVGPAAEPGGGRPRLITAPRRCYIVAPRRPASLDTFFVAVKPSSSALRIGLSLITS